MAFASLFYKIITFAGIVLLLVTASMALAGGVVQTGQTKCYDSAGTEINCAGTGQDGETWAMAAWQPFGFFNCKLREIVRK